MASSHNHSTNKQKTTSKLNTTLSIYPTKSLHFVLSHLEIFHSIKIYLNDQNLSLGCLGSFLCMYLRTSRCTCWIILLAKNRKSKIMPTMFEQVILFCPLTKLNGLDLCMKTLANLTVFWYLWYWLDISMQRFPKPGLDLNRHLMRDKERVLGPGQTKRLSKGCPWGWWA